MGIKREGLVLHRKGGVWSHRVDVFSVCVGLYCTDGVFVREGNWRNTHTDTHLAHDITAY